MGLKLLICLPTMFCLHQPQLGGMGKYSIKSITSETNLDDVNVDRP